MNAIIDTWIRRNYAHDVSFDLAPQLQALIDAAIAAAVQAEREANQRDMQQLADAAHMAIEYVGAANYPERQSEAHQGITDTAAAIRARSNGAGSK